MAEWGIKIMHLRSSVPDYFFPPGDGSRSHAVEGLAALFSPAQAECSEIERDAEGLVGFVVGGIKYQLTCR